MSHFGPLAPRQPQDSYSARPPGYESAAVIAFILALFSFCVWFIPNIVAIALASGAKRNIAASNGTRKGKGLATAAQVISVLSFLGAAIGIALSLSL